MNQRLLGPTLLLLSAVLLGSGCSGGDANAGGSQPAGQTGPGAPAADSQQGSSFAAIAINYPGNTAYAGGPARVALVVQGTGDLSTSACQSTNGPLSGNYDSYVTVAGGGPALLDLSMNQAAWMGAGCSAPARSGVVQSVDFRTVSSAVVTAEIPANTANCHDYCFGQPRAPSCEEHCLTFLVIQVNQPLNAGEILAYESTGQINKAVYLNELH